MTAEVTTLSEEPAVFRAEIGLRVLPDRTLEIQLTGVPRLPFGSPLKIVEGENLWLAEITRHQPDGSIVARVLHSLSGAHDLARLASRFLGQETHDGKPAETPTLS